MSKKNQNDKEKIPTKDKGNVKNTEKNNKKIKVFIDIMIVIILCVLIFSCLKIFIWSRDNRSNEEQIEEIKEIVTVENEDNNEDDEEEFVLDFEKLKEKNPDTVGWIKVEGTNINYPVVKTTDNDFYINHGFDKSVNGAGWIFIDYRNKLDGTDKNLILYGHNRRNGTMFESLKNTLTPEWYNNEENKYVTFTTETEEIKYEVFSTYKIEVEDYYIETEFTSKTYEKFLKTIKNRSVKNYGVEVTKNDSILTLSTCADNNDNRIVLHAKKIVK